MQRGVGVEQRLCVCACVFGAVFINLMNIIAAVIIYPNYLGGSSLGACVRACVRVSLFAQNH